MKFNLDAARYVLLEMEKLPYGETLYFDDMADRSKKYKKDDLQYACLKLFEGGLIRAYTIGDYGSEISRVEILVDITFQGHQFLENIRDPETWRKTKSVIRSLGSASLSVVESVSSGIINGMISGLLPKV